MSELIKAASRAKGAARALAIATTEEKNQALRLIADALTANMDDILAANALDLESERAKGTGAALLDRLTLTEARIADMAEGARWQPCPTLSERKWRAGLWKTALISVRSAYPSALSV